MDEITTNDYWDCECEFDYIHSKAQSTCSLCGTSSKDQPDSIKDEVDFWLKLGVKL